MCILPKTEICHFVHFIFRHIYSPALLTSEAESWNKKIARLVKYISGRLKSGKKRKKI